MSNIIDLKSKIILQPLLQFVNTGVVATNLTNKDFKSIKKVLLNQEKWEVYSKAYEDLYTSWLKADVASTLDNYKQVELSALHDLDEISHKHYKKAQPFANIAIYNLIKDVNINPLLAAKWVIEEIGFGDLDDLNPHEAKIISWLRQNIFELLELIDEFIRDITTILSKYDAKSDETNAGVKRLIILLQDYKNTKDIFYNFMNGTNASTISNLDYARQLAVEFWESITELKDPGYNEQLMNIIQPVFPQSPKIWESFLLFLENNYDRIMNAVYFNKDSRLQYPEFLIILYILQIDQKNLVKRWVQFKSIKQLESLANIIGETVM